MSYLSDWRDWEDGQRSAEAALRAEPPEDAIQRYEAAGNAALANGLVLKARRLFRQADAIRRAALNDEESNG